MKIGYLASPTDGNERERGGKELVGRREAAELHAHRELIAQTTAALANDFSNDRDRDFLGRLSADIEPDRGVDLSKLFARETIGFQTIKRGLDAPARSNHSDEPRFL